MNSYLEFGGTADTRIPLLETTLTLELVDEDVLVYAGSSVQLIDFVATTWDSSWVTGSYNIQPASEEGCGLNTSLPQVISISLTEDPWDPCCTGEISSDGTINLAAW